MIMFMITRPRGKMKKLFAAGGMVLLLGVIVPGIYFALSGMGAMSLFAAGDNIDGGGAVSPAPADGAEQEKEANEGIEGGTETAADNINAESDAIGGGESAAAADGEETPADEKTTEPAKPGFLQSLKEELFGEQPQVQLY